MSRTTRKKYKLGNRIPALDNPIAKALERRDTQRWIDEMVAYLAEMEDGKECKTAMEHVLSFVCPAMKSIEGWDDPDGIGDVLVDCVEAACNVINSGRWDKTALPAITAGIKYAREVIGGMPVVNIAAAKRFTDALLIRATEPE
jgi:ferredoxin-like protein FixX